jgi:hypothetical protein
MIDVFSNPGPRFRFPPAVARSLFGLCLFTALSGSWEPARAADCDRLACSPDLCRQDGLSTYLGAERIIKKGNAPAEEVEEAICRLQCDKVEVMLRNRPPTGMVRGVGNRPTPFFPDFLQALGYDQLGCSEQSIREWGLVRQNVITRNVVYKDDYARFSASIGAKRNCEVYRAHLNELSGWSGTGGKPRFTDEGTRTLASLQEQGQTCNSAESLGALQAAVAQFQQVEGTALRTETDAVPGGAIRPPALPAAADLDSLEGWRNGFRNGYSGLDAFWRGRHTERCREWNGTSDRIDGAIGGSAGFLQARNADLLQRLSAASSADPAAAAACGSTDGLGYGEIRDLVPAIEQRTANAAGLLDEVDAVIASARGTLAGRVQALRSSVNYPGRGQCPSDLENVAGNRVQEIEALSGRFEAISASAGDALATLETDLAGLEQGADGFRQALVRERDRILERNRKYLGDGDPAFEGLKGQDAGDLGALCARARAYVAASNSKKQENWSLVVADLQQGRQQLEKYRGFFRTAAGFVPDDGVPECIDRELGWLSQQNLGRYNEEASNRSDEVLTCGNQAGESFVAAMGGLQDRFENLCRMRTECFQAESDWSSTGFRPMDDRSASQLEKACGTTWIGTEPDQAAEVISGFGGSFRPDRVRSALENCVVVGNIHAAATALHDGRIDDGLAALQPFAGAGPPRGGAGVVISGTGACLLYLKTISQPDADPRVRKLLTRESQRWAEQYFRLSEQNPSVSLDGVFPPVCVDRFHVWGDSLTPDRSG